MWHTTLVVLGIILLSVFLLLNGPLWLTTKLRFLAHGPEASYRLVSFTKRASRVAAIIGILFWLTIVSQGSVTTSLLLGASLIGAAFLLLSGPIWLSTRILFFRGRSSEVPLKLQVGIIWISRLAGAGILVSSLYLAFYLYPGGS